MRSTKIILAAAIVSMISGAAVAQKSRTCMGVNEGDCPRKSSEQIDRENNADRQRNQQYQSTVKPCYGQNCTTSAK